MRAKPDFGRRSGRAVATALCLAACSLVVGVSVAHELVIDYRVAPSVALEARVAGGGPLAGGLVEVYPPGASSPVTTGVCDDQGRYVYRPQPPVESGVWRFRVRQGGHAHVVDVRLGGEVQAREGSSRLSLLQYAVMIGCVLWGLVGTGLYALRRRR